MQILLFVGEWEYQNEYCIGISTSESEGRNTFLQCIRDLNATGNRACSPYIEFQTPTYNGQWRERLGGSPSRFIDIVIKEHKYFAAIQYLFNADNICEGRLENNPEPGAPVFPLIRTREAKCPQWLYKGNEACINTKRAHVYTNATYELNPGPPPNDCEHEGDDRGNPCSPATGNKSQTETDYSTGSNSSLNFSRHYNSLGEYRHGKHLAPGWRPNFSAAMDEAPSQDYIGLAGGEASSAYATPEAACLQGFAEIKANVWGGALAEASAEYAGGNLCRIFKDQQTLSWFIINGGSTGTAPANIHTFTRANGMLYVFQQDNGQWLDALNPNVKLHASGDNWVFTDSNNNKETYNASGQLITITATSGRSRNLSYDLATDAGGDGNPETLDRVTDAAGRSLSFVYTDNAGKPRLSTLSTPDGDITYNYDAKDNLNTVAYPDGNSKTYHYEDSNFPHHLTGITDENALRFATWAYNADGKAILSEHAGGVEQVKLAYNADGTTTIIGALGDTSTYHFEVQNGYL